MYTGNFIPLLQKSDTTILNNQDIPEKNGTYIVSSSYITDFLYDGLDFSDYQAFAYEYPSNAFYWAVWNHSSFTVLDNVMVNGEWLQIQIPCLFQMTSFSTYSVYISPRSIMVAGSNDGTNWNKIVFIPNTGLTNTYIGNDWNASNTAYATFETQLENKNYYKYFRFIVTSPGGTQTNIGKLNISGFVFIPEPKVPCFNEGTNILTNKGYIPVQHLKYGDLIQTINHGFVPIYMIGKKNIHHSACKERIKEQLYKCASDRYSVFEDLIITGCHSILVDEFVDEKQRLKVIEINGDTYITDNKYRLPICADERASVYDIEGDYTVYHIALENEDFYTNYGIYANGLLVETCSKIYLKELSSMEIIEE